MAGCGSLVVERRGRRGFTATASLHDFGYAGIVLPAGGAIPGIGHRVLHWDTIVIFWFAYIFTRPLGASFADLFGMTR